MANFGAGEIGTFPGTNRPPGTEEEPGCSFVRAVEDLSLHGSAQAESLREKQKSLSGLQATLSDIEEKGETAARELESKMRGILLLEGEMERLERHAEALRDRCASVGEENAELRACIGEEEEEGGSAHMALAQFGAYRNKMERHRAVVLHKASQTEAHRELGEKRALVRMLTWKKQELSEDLEDPNGSTVQMAKTDIDALKGEIYVMGRSIAEMREKMKKEFETQAQIKRDIEIQNRRYEAVVKRLHCRLSRAQAVHREMSKEIQHMERRLARLRGQLGSPKGSVASDH